jgi:hypothetical protein
LSLFRQIEIGRENGLVHVQLGGENVVLVGVFGGRVGGRRGRGGLGWAGRGRVVGSGLRDGVASGRRVVCGRGHVFERGGPVRASMRNRVCIDRLLIFGRERVFRGTLRLFVVEIERFVGLRSEGAVGRGGVVCRDLLIGVGRRIRFLFLVCGASKETDTEEAEEKENGVKIGHDRARLSQGRLKTNGQLHVQNNACEAVPGGRPAV